MKACVLILLLLPAFAGSAFGQDACPPARGWTAVDTSSPDIVISARVQARVLRFNVDPETSLRVRGCPALDTAYLAVRTNLPTPVKSNVVYQNVIVDFRLRMKIAELDCLLAHSMMRISADSMPVAQPPACRPPSGSIPTRP